MERRGFLFQAVAGAVSLFSPAPLRARTIGRLDVDPVTPGRTELTARFGTEPLVGMPYPWTPIWGFDGSVPGPEIRLRRGQPLALRVMNALDTPTSVHWHGVRLPWAMDGVAGLTQAPIEPGTGFDVDFTPPDAGTYWYHAHADTAEQVGRGLYGPLIVEEEEPVAVDRELVWMLDDWRLAPDASIVEDFGHWHDLSHGGRMGNTVTLNGRRNPPVRVRAGERLRLRLINAANARQFALDFADLPVQLIAIDGQPVPPHQPPSPVGLPSGGRVDLIVDLPATPSSTFEIVDRYYRDAIVIGSLALDAQPPVRNGPPETPIDAGSPSLPEPDLSAALAHTIVIRGGAMGGMRAAVLDGSRQSARELAQRGVFWSLNDLAMHGYDMPPVLDVQRGRTVRLTLINDTAFVHPMHLHGHHVKLLSVDGKAPELPIWHDTVPVAPRQRIELAFVADNPGRWLMHCHVLEHRTAGMGALVRIA